MSTDTLTAARRPEATHRPTCRVFLTRQVPLVVPIFRDKWDGRYERTASGRGTLVCSGGSTQVPDQATEAAGAGQQQPPPGLCGGASGGT